MPKIALYSSRIEPDRPDRALPGGETARRGRGDTGPGPASAAAPAPAAPAGLRRRFGALLATPGRRERLLWLAAGVLIALGAGWLAGPHGPAPRALTQKDIDAAVLHSLKTQPLPSRPAQAYAVIQPSVVRVVSRGIQGEQAEPGSAAQLGVGSGVVIVDTGLILTSLHVVAGASRVSVEFYDGLESEATVVSAQPQNDLAVLQAKTVPDDLAAATLRSTRDLAPGDEVIAVGFPFGIGPSVSAGVVSGLRREYRAPDRDQALSNLIQFDAAANPGSSGGPLVTADGEVVGIVTAILNPTDQRFFVGIGFAVPIENAASAVGLSPF